MNRSPVLPASGRNRFAVAHRGRRSARRGGAVIIVVLSLMAMLAFLGFFFYDFVQIEGNTAQNFAEKPETEVDYSAVMEVGLEQVVFATDDEKYKASALGGNKHSMLAHIIGTLRPKTTGGIKRYVPRDYELRNGHGITVTTSPLQFLYTRNDHYYSPDGTSGVVPGIPTAVSDLVLNRGRAVNSGGASPFDGNGKDADTAHAYEPDVSDDYPDQNMLFAAVDYINEAGNRVIKPSFFLPSIYYSMQPDTTQWYRETGTGARMLRPHTEHLIPGVSDRRFSQQFPGLGATAAAVPVGGWTASGTDYSGLDTDTNNDGIPDSIYLDLGHPPITLSSGGVVIPIYSFKIEDVNGLINLNSAGNPSSLIATSRTGTPDLNSLVLNSNRPISYSNLGLSRAEVSPIYALSADPTSLAASVFQWDGAFYRTATAPTFNKLQLANTELAMMLFGSPVSMMRPITTGYDFTSRLDDVVGRFGEPMLIQSTATGKLPGPGNVEVDDNQNSATFTNTAFQAGHAVGVHPTDYVGLGSTPILSEDLNGNGTLDLGEDLNGNSKIDYLRGRRGLTGFNGAYRFPYYNGYWQFEGYPRIGTYHDSLSTPAPLGTLVNTFNGLIDEAQEQNPYRQQYSEDTNGNGTLDSGEDTNGNSVLDTYDNPFALSEMAALHLSDYDWIRLGAVSRLRNLAPVNFNLADDAARIRRRFTVHGWNRKEFSFPFNPIRSFEFADVEASEDTDGNGTLSGGEDQDGDNKIDRILRFPPAFGGISSRHENTTPIITANDPYRPEVRRLLTVRAVQGDLANWDTNGTLLRDRAKHPQLPLELNRILDDNDPSNRAFDAKGNPYFRPLTPHPDLKSLTGTLTIPAIPHDNGATLAHPVANRLAGGEAQEWWARYDRQRLARDIYVLLVTLCTPNGNVTGAIDAGVAEEMAQFAVNYVDAMDADDAITRFEYDPNLQDGWATAPSGVVFGVEAQKLAFSEGLWIRQNKETGDVPKTWHIDNDGYHQWLYVELHNPTVGPVSLATDTWRIIRVDPDDTTDAKPAPPNPLAILELHSSLTVPAGGNFVIGTHDGNVKHDLMGTELVTSADFYADTDTLSPEFELVVPATGTPASPTAATMPPPQLDLDLQHASQSTEFTVSGSTLPGGGFLLWDATATAIDTSTKMTLVLQRRRTFDTGGHLTQAASDWIDVDIIEIEPKDLAIPSDTEVPTEVAKIKSRERDHVFSRPELGTNLPEAIATASATNLSSHTIDPAGGNRLNSVMVANTVATQWQPHFDRELTSAYELLSIPVVSPYYLLESIRESGFGSGIEGKISGWAKRTTGMPGQDIPYAAAVRFVPEPNAPSPATPSTTPKARSERPAPNYSTGVIPWVRLLNFVALPDLSEVVQTQANSHFVRSRTYGEVNINLVREREVLLGLIDDPTVESNVFPVPASPVAADVGKDKYGGATPRNWWTDLVNQRDANVALGALNSRPFRSPGVYDASGSTPASGAQHTLLRQKYTSFPPTLTSPNPAPLGLFEARNEEDATDGATANRNVVDVHTRNRILSKLGNNVTTRSHVFVIFARVDFFQASEIGSVGSGNYQIGAKSAEMEPGRWFFVVDMTRLEEAYDTSTQTFDWRKFVIYRQRLE